MHHNRHVPSVSHDVHGMTLLEVMVALVIVAISLLAASRAFSQWVYGSQQLHERMLAEVCAQNTLTQWELSPTLPSVGTESVFCEQDGLLLHINTDVSSTKNPKFHKAHLQVFGPSSDQTVLVSITTAIAKP